jgi:hypothetical protein
MQRILTLAAAIALVAAPALAQTTTTVKTTDNPPPPPPSTSTTVTTQPQSGSSTTVTTGQPPPPSSSTQVVVNPNEPAPSTRTTTTRVRAGDEAVGVGVETHREGRTDIAIIATDALYGGLAGVLIGGGIALINNGSNWGRDLMVGGGIGILAGAAFGVVEAATREDRTTVRRAAADRDPGASSGAGLSLLAGKF